jgi:phosphoribosyl 1,2-cyclic phosphodiesterase
MFKITVFGTGSRGNSALVTDGETNILIDAGVNPDIIQSSIMITDINAVLATHEHQDHSKFSLMLSRKYMREIYATKGTLSHIEFFFGIPVSYGESFYIGTLTITPFPLSHDAAEPCGFFIRNGIGETLVWCSDTGTMDGLQMDKPADGYVLEANYDENTIDEKLEKGELPYDGLHGRLTSEFGHLSIQQAAVWLKENARQDSHIILLSPHKEVLERNKDLFGVHERDGFGNIAFPTEFPFTYEFGKKIPF